MCASMVTTRCHVLGGLHVASRERRSRITGWTDVCETDEECTYLQRPARLSTALGRDLRTFETRTTTTMSTLVSDSSDRSSVPFLRGILTQSLIDVGLDFDEAYKLADSVRTELSDVDEITTEELRSIIAKRLKGRKERSAYDAVPDRPRPPAADSSLRHGRTGVAVFERSAWPLAWRSARSRWRSGTASPPRLSGI